MPQPAVRVGVCGIPLGKGESIMGHSPSAHETSRSSSRFLFTVLLICVLLAGAGGIAFIWLMTEPTYIVRGMVRIAPVVRSVLTNEPQPDEAASYVQFVNTQALLLMSDEQRLQKIVDDLAGRNLAFFSGRPSTRLEELLAKVWPRDVTEPPDQVLRKAIAKQEITAGYVPDSELMAVTMRSQNNDEARSIVNSFLRNYVGQYGVESTTRESQDIMILENQRTEYQKRIAESRQKLRLLEMRHGLDSLQQVELQSQPALQARLVQLEMDRIKVQADIEVYEKTEKLDLSPERIVAARTEHINSDPMIKELTARIVQTEVDLIVASQTSPPPDPATSLREAALKAFRQKLQERRESLAQEFDSILLHKLEEAARQRMFQAEAERTQLDAHINRIRALLDEQHTQAVAVGTASLAMQDLQRELKMHEEVLDQVTRRLTWFGVEQDRRPRVQIASLAEVKEVVAHRGQWTFVAVLVTVALGLVLWRKRRAAGLPSEMSGA